MARGINRLTDREVKGKLAPGMHADGGGLYLQVTGGKAGARSWLYRYARKGRTRYMGLGSLADISLAGARSKAEEARKLHAAGKDPIEERAASQAREAAQKQAEAARAVTFRDAAQAYIEGNETAWRNDKHREQWRSTLETYVYPVLGDVAVADVDTDLVLKVLTQPVKGKDGEPTQLWRARTETASRVRGRIERVLAAAKVNGHRTGDNPALWRGHLAEILPKRSKVAKVRHHPALPWTKVPEFMARLRERDGITARALEFTILAAVRTNETIGATFDEFDLAARTWAIPGERMKAGQEHRVPLCDRAVAIVKDMQKHALNAYVFPGTVRDSGLSNMAMLMLLRDIEPGITVHGFRSSFRDWAGEATNYPHDVCEAALAHTREGKVHGAYQRGDLFAKRQELMADWARFCEPKRKAKRSEDSRAGAEKTRTNGSRPNLPILEETSGEVR